MNRIERVQAIKESIEMALLRKDTDVHKLTEAVASLASEVEILARVVARIETKQGTQGV